MSNHVAHNQDQEVPEDRLRGQEALLHQEEQEGARRSPHLWECHLQPTQASKRTTEARTIEKTMLD